MARGRRRIECFMMCVCVRVRVRVHVCVCDLNVAVVVSVRGGRDVQQVHGAVLRTTNIYIMNYSLSALKL